MQQISSIQVGSVVTVRESGFAEEETYTIVLPHDARPTQNRVSNNSPFGMALMNQSPGRTVAYEAPAGPIEFEIVEVM